jgi:hypothetical protein
VAVLRIGETVHDCASKTDLKGDFWGSKAWD